jgi:UDP-3-O-[3-hydroxymyristoyl] glucosamine N-acyltransferase
MHKPTPEPVYSEQIADFLGVAYDGQSVTLTEVNGLDVAGPSELAFSTYEEATPVEQSDAGMVIAPTHVTDGNGTAVIQSDDPQLAFLRVVDEFFTPMPKEAAVHPMAVVEDEADIGTGTIIGPFCYVTSNVTIGEDCRIYPGTALGTKGKGYVRDDGRLLSHRYRGSVVIDDEVVIGSNCVIDRSIFGQTQIGFGTKLDNLVHIAHDVDIGSHVWINQLTSIAGHGDIGDGVRLHPCISISHHVVIGDYAVVGTNSTILADIAASKKIVGIHS